MHMNYYIHVNFNQYMLDPKKSLFNEIWFFFNALMCVFLDKLHV